MLAWAWTRQHGHLPGLWPARWRVNVGKGRRDGQRVRNRGNRLCMGCGDVGCVVEGRSLTGELSLSCARPTVHE